MMKFSVNAQEMKAVVSFVSKAISAKNPLPILGTVKIEMNEKGEMSITGGDTGLFLTVSMPVIEVEDFRPLCIDAAMLSDCLGVIGRQIVKFEVSERSATMIYDTGHFNFAIESANEYPNVEGNIEAVDAFDIPVEDFSRWVGTCRAYTIDDEFRPVMGGVYLDLTGEHLVMAATDGHKLIRKAFPDIKTHGKIGSIITGRTAALLSAYQRPVEMTVRISERQTVFMADGFRLVATNIEGCYPNYNGVIPHQNPIKLSVGRQALSTALKRSLTMGNKASALVKFSVYTYMNGDGHLDVQSQDLDFSRSASETLLCEHNCEGTFTIGFKGTFLQTLLSTHTTDQIIFEFSDPSRAGVMRDADGGDADLLTLIMPMMLND